MARFIGLDLVGLGFAFLPVVALAVAAAQSFQKKKTVSKSSFQKKKALKTNNMLPKSSFRKKKFPENKKKFPKSSFQ